MRSLVDCDVPIHGYPNLRKHVSRSGSHPTDHMLEWDALRASSEDVG
jgi:hypothetical protein